MRLTDTAGLRHATGAVEALGVARSREKLAEADAVVLVLDGGRVLPDRAAARTHPQMTIRFRDGEMRVMQPNKEGAYGSEKEADV